MSKRIIALLLSMLVTACERPELRRDAAGSAASAAETETDFDADNLLNLAYGASVVARTGELHLESSAVEAIDGNAWTAWTSPPHAPAQTLIFSLPAPARIARLGVTLPNAADRVPSQIRFEASPDAVVWREVLLLRAKPDAKPQIENVTPFESRYIRVTTLEKKEDYAQIRSIHAVGTASGPPARPSLRGCWIINGAPASFHEQAGVITGTVAMEPPLVFSGAADGGVAKLMWYRGAMWGYAAIATGPDARTLSGLTYHENVSTYTSGAALFGARGADATNPAACEVEALPSAPHQFLSRSGRWAMYGLAFDTEDRLIEHASSGTLDAAATVIASSPAQRFRIVAHEFREPDPERNRKRTDLRIAAVRAALQKRGVTADRVVYASHGSTWDQPEIITALQRGLHGAVELQLQR